MNYIPYRFVFDEEHITLHTLLKLADDYPLTNVDSQFDLSNFYNCVEDAVAAEIDKYDLFSSEEEALNFLIKTLEGIAIVIYFDMTAIQEIHF